jgi:hypothetical protein
MPYFVSKFLPLLHKKVPATGLGLFRIGYGLIALQEIFCCISII